MDVSRVMGKHQASRARVLDGLGGGVPKPITPFRSLLKAIQPNSSPEPIAKAAPAPKMYTVQRGDNLSHICKDFMREQGQPTKMHLVHDAVQRVARANGLGNANLIYPGQKLDLSSISLPSVGPVAKAAPPLPELPVVAANTPMGGPEAPAVVGKVKAMAASVERHPSSPWSGILGGEGRITSNFGIRRDPFTGKAAFHKGVDIAAPKGTPIKAYRSGLVTFSGWQRGYGNVVIMRHTDGTETRYAHASRRLVSKGDFVRGGSSIAQVGSTGRSTGNHVHFEVRRKGEAIDPMPYLRRQPLQVAKVL